MIHRYVLHNDAIEEAAARCLSPSQTGLLSGWGVFSTLRIIDGVPFAFERHWARMARDAATLHVPLPEDPDRVRVKLLELVAMNEAANSTMRVVVVRNSGGIWSPPEVGRAVDLLALTADTKQWGRGVKLACVRNARHAACQFAGAKMLSWAMNLTWLESVQSRGFDEALLLNERGEVAECTSANIFVAVGNQVFTPPLNSGCLPGITREVLLAEVHTPGIEIVERTVVPSDLESADEVFITSTTRELLPVLEIDGKPTGKADRVRSILQAAFTEFEANYIAARKR